MSGRPLMATGLTGIAVTLILMLAACGDSAPPTRAPLVERALTDPPLRKQLIERGAADEEFVHEILEKFSLEPGGNEKLAEILAAHFEHHPETARAVFRRLKTQQDLGAWLTEQVEDE